MQKGDGSYTRAGNCDKDYHNVVSSSLRCCGFFANAFPPLTWVFKLCSSKLSLFLDFGFLKYDNANRLGKYFIRRF